MLTHAQKLRRQAAPMSVHKTRTNTQQTCNAATVAPRPTTPHPAKPTTPNQDRNKPARGRAKPTANATQIVKHGVLGRQPVSLVARGRGE